MRPGIGSAVLHKGRSEIRLSGAIGTFFNNASAPDNQTLTVQDQKFDNLTTSGFYGLRKWLNIGVVYQFMHFKENYLNVQTPFTSKYNTNQIGPQAKIKLINHYNRTECYVQFHVLFPIDKYMLPSKITYAGQLITTTRIGYKWVFSLQLATYIYPKHVSERHPISIPASIFVGYLVKNRFMPYLIASYNSDLGTIRETKNDSYDQINYAGYGGIGGKYEVFRNIDFAAYYLYALKSKNNDKFNSFSASMLILF
jgi:hypothetical protein